MRKTLTMLFLLAMPCLHAQVTLQDVELFTPGSTQTLVSGTPSQFNPGAAGANVSWNFSGIFQDGDTVVQEFITPKQTIFGSQFPDANVVEKAEEGVYVFMKVEGAQNRILGRVDENQGLVMKFSDSYISMQRPLSYQDDVNSTYTYEYAVSAVESSGAGTNQVVADAYGTLTLPTGTYQQVLRVRSESVAIDTNDNGLVTTVHTITYAWYDAQHRSALLEMDSVWVENMFFSDLTLSANMLVEEDIAVGLAQKSQSLFRISATPQGDVLIQYPHNGPAQLSVYTLGGKEIHSERIFMQADVPFQFQMNRSQLPAGMYFLRLSDGTAVQTEKVIVQ